MFSVWFYKKLCDFEPVSCNIDPRGEYITSSSFSKCKLSVIFNLRLYVRKTNGNWVFQTCSERTLGTRSWCLNGSPYNGPLNDAIRLIIDSLRVATVQVRIPTQTKFSPVFRAFVI